MRTEASRLTPINDAYETCERTLAKLRIYGDELDPISITSLLGIEPNNSQKKGEIKRNSRGFEKKVKVGGWFLSSEGHVQSKDVRKHLDWLLARLVPVRDQLRALQATDGIVMAVTCIWWSAAGDGGPTLWPEQMHALAELNLECSFELAFYRQDEDQ
jgi:hypothetical protein